MVETCLIFVSFCDISTKKLLKIYNKISFWQFLPWLNVRNCTAHHYVNLKQLEVYFQACFIVLDTFQIVLIWKGRFDSTSCFDWGLWNTSATRFFFFWKLRKMSDSREMEVSDFFFWILRKIKMCCKKQKQNYFREKINVWEIKNGKKSVKNVRK